MALSSCAVEYLWIAVVFDRFPELRESEPQGFRVEAVVKIEGWRGPRGKDSWFAWMRRESEDWLEFSRLPIFASTSLEPRPTHHAFRHHSNRSR